MVYFVKRRDETETFVNILCNSLEEVSQRVDSFRARGVECWVEDGDGNPITDSTLKMELSRSENRGRLEPKPPQLAASLGTEM